MTAIAHTRRPWLTDLNTTGHRTGLAVFLAIVLAR